MITPQRKRIVEIPIDKDVDQVSIHERLLDKRDGKEKYHTKIYKGKETQPYENFNIVEEESEDQNFSRQAAAGNNVKH